MRAQIGNKTHGGLVVVSIIYVQSFNSLFLSSTNPLHSFLSPHLTVLANFGGFLVHIAITVITIIII